MKKLVTCLLGASILLNSSLVLVGCEEKNKCEHVYDLGVYAVVKAPTCTEDGEIKKICDKCGYATSFETDKLGHSFTRYVSNNDATFSKDGTKTATCDRDGCSATDTIADFGSMLTPSNEELAGEIIGSTNHDVSKGNGTISKLNFGLFTGTNGEFMLPGVQINPNVSVKLTNIQKDQILRAVFNIEVEISDALTNEQREEVARVVNSSIIEKTNRGETEYFVNINSEVPENVYNNSPVGQELVRLKMIQDNIMTKLINSALYNGWVYRAGNSSSSVAGVEYGSNTIASKKYYRSGYTTNQDTPNVDNVSRSVQYGAFYFRGWQGVKSYTAPADTYDAATGNGIKYVDRGIDGIYAVTYNCGSQISSKYVGGGREYHISRVSAGDIAVLDSTLSNASQNEYAVLEGILQKNNTIKTYADPLGYKRGDITSNGSEVDNIGVLNVSTHNGAYENSNIKDSWQSSGTQKTNEDMMCIIKSNYSINIPLFTTSFMLPSTWLHELLADRHINIGITFQTMQAEYLASGYSRHCSVELAESRFDDVSTIVLGEVYQKEESMQPNFDDIDYWIQPNSDE